MDPNVTRSTSSEPTQQTTPLPQAAVNTQGILGGRFFSRLKISSNSSNSKSNSIAMTRINQSPTGTLDKLQKKITERGLAKGRLVKIGITVQNAEGTGTHTETVALNVKSAAKRLGIAKQTVLDIAAKEKFDPVLGAIHGSTASGEKINKFLTGHRSQQVSIKDISELYITTIVYGNKEGVFAVGEKTFVLKDGRVTKARSDDKVFGLNRKKEIGKGTFGTVYKIKELCIKSLTFSEFAEKVSNLGENGATQRALRDMKFESENINTLANAARQEGVDPRIASGLPLPLRSVRYQDNLRGAMSMELYGGHIAQGKFSTEQKLAGMDGLIRGFAFSQTQGLIHLDIKPENIFFDKNPNDTPTFRLGDWGGARTEQFVRDYAETKPLMLAMTSPFVPYDSVETILDAKAAGPEMLQQVATFEMGVTLFKLLSNGAEPYRRKEWERSKREIKPEFSDTSQPFNEWSLQRNNIPPKVIDFIKTLCDPDGSKRPTGDALVQAWDSLIAEFGSLENLCHNRIEPVSVGTTTTGSAKNALFDSARPYVVEDMSTTGALQFFSDPANYDQGVVRWSERNNDYVLNLLRIDDKGQTVMAEVSLTDISKAGIVDILEAAKELRDTGQVKGNQEEF